MMFAKLLFQTRFPMSSISYHPTSPVFKYFSDLFITSFLQSSPKQSTRPTFSQPKSIPQRTIVQDAAYQKCESKQTAAGAWKNISTTALSLLTLKEYSIFHVDKLKIIDKKIQSDE